MVGCRRIREGEEGFEWRPRAVECSRETDCREFDRFSFLPPRSLISSAAISAQRTSGLSRCAQPGTPITGGEPAGGKRGD